MTSVQRVTFPAGQRHPMEAWVAQPNGTGPHPAVLVVHEIYGLVDNLKDILQRFADEGYFAFAPNLYDRPALRPVCVARCLVSMQRGEGEAVEDLHAAISYMSNDEHVDETRLGVTGFCMGGGFALVMALDARIGVSAPFYGMSEAYAKDIGKSCPVVASYGERDRVFRGPGKKLKRHLERAGIVHDHKVYPETGHSFMTKSRGTWTERLGRYGPMRVAYHPESSDDAWRRMLTFFGKHIGSG